MDLVDGLDLMDGMDGMDLMDGMDILDVSERTPRDVGRFGLRPKRERPLRAAPEARKEKRSKERGDGSVRGPLSGAALRLPGPSAHFGLRPKRES
jgi:hypothetical protein